MKKLQKSKIIKIIGAAILLLILHWFGILRPVEDYVIRILNPILKPIYALSSSLRHTYYQQTTKIDLAASVENCQKELNRLLAENARLKIVEEENKILRDHLNFQSKHNFQYILANVISRDSLVNSGTLNNIIIIDKGKYDGVVPGLLVLNEEGMVVGKVAQSKNYLAQVDLVTSRQCRLAVSTLTNGKTIGVIEGELGLTIKMGFIPQTENLQVGDVVISSGLEKNIPHGLVIGKISKINRESNELWQSATVEPLADLENLNIVSVVKPQNPQ